MSSVPDAKSKQPAARWMKKIKVKHIPSEKSQTDKVIDWLNSLQNCVAVKKHQTVMDTAGEPDINGCIKMTCLVTQKCGDETIGYDIPIGQRFDIEMKKKGKKPTKIQERRIAEWAAAGSWAFWADSLEDVQAYFKQRGIE